MNKKAKGLIVASLIGVMSLGLISCGDKKDGSLAKHNKIVIGIDDTFVPMGFKDEGGQIVGFDVELAKAVSKKLNKEVEFQPIDWSMKETELDNGKIDLIWNGYSMTDERKEKVKFSKPYLKNRQIIITLADSKINNKAGLKGKVVAAQNQSSAVDAIEKDKDIIKTFKGEKIVTFETNNEALMDLEANRVDAVVADEILAKYYIKQRGANKYKVISEDFGSETYGVGMRKDDSDMQENINKALDEIIKDGTASEISKKWFGEDIILK